MFMLLFCLCGSWATYQDIEYGHDLFDGTVFRVGTSSIVAPSLTEATGWWIHQNNDLKCVSLPELQTLDGALGFNVNLNPNLKMFSAPKVESITANRSDGNPNGFVFYGNAVLEVIDVSSLTHLEHNRPYLISDNPALHTILVSDDPPAQLTYFCNCNPGTCQQQADAPSTDVTTYAPEYPSVCCPYSDAIYLITATTAPSGTAIGLEKYADSKLIFNSIFCCQVKIITTSFLRFGFGIRFS